MPEFIFKGTGHQLRAYADDGTFVGVVVRTTSWGCEVWKARRPDGHYVAVQHRPVLFVNPSEAARHLASGNAPKVKPSLEFVGALARVAGRAS